MSADSLTDKGYWTRQTAGFRPVTVDGHAFAPLLRRYLPAGSGLSCAEVGAYPGTFLCYLAKSFGYRATAIEYRDDADDIAALFEHNGLARPEIVNADFLQLKGLQFDVVASQGFVEHFSDYETVIRLHVEMMKPGGHLVLSVPYLLGLQGGLRRILLTEEARAELYRTHNLRVMKLSVVEGCLRNLGLEILYGSYVMGGSFWIPSDSPRIKPGMRWLAAILQRLDRAILHRLPSSFLYSPMLLCIARKK